MKWKVKLRQLNSIRSIQVQGPQSEMKSLQNHKKHSKNYFWQQALQIQNLFFFTSERSLSYSRGKRSKANRTPNTMEWSSCVEPQIYRCNVPPTSSRHLVGWRRAGRRRSEARSTSESGCRRWTKHSKTKLPFWDCYTCFGYKTKSGGNAYFGKFSTYT